MDKPEIMPNRFSLVTTHEGLRRPCRVAGWIFATIVAMGWHGTIAAAEIAIHYFPSGSIYEYRWKLLDLALKHTKGTDGLFQITPYAEEATQNRALALVQSGAIDVIALGINQERESKLLAVRVDILRGIVGFRLLLIRSNDEERIAKMDEHTLRKELKFGLNSQWADLAVMRANGLSVITSSSYENLFGMLVAGRFDAFPRGLNEAARELQERKHKYPQLAVEKHKALYFPYPVYFWVNKDNAALAQRIERGLKLSMADGSFRRLFESYHAAEITMMKKEKRHVIRLDNPLLSAGDAPPDPSWWWRGHAASH